MKCILVAGARPNFMKIAPLMKELARVKLSGEASLEYKLVHTGQHYDIQMSEIFFKELEIPAPDINLEVGSASHAVQTASLLTGFETVCLREKPDWIVVVGDVNSTMACTLVAAKMGIKVAHVEAGLRSFDRTMPEEINRLVTDALADYLFTPSRDGDENLRREGVPEEKIKFVGNIMIDTLVSNLDKARKCRSYARFGFQEKEFVYVTLHRPANVDDPATLQTILDSLESVAATLPVIFPVHPRTRKMLSRIGFNPGPKITITDPVGYHDSLCLAEKAAFVLTDSGGLQEETTYFQTPCLTLRPNTERPVTVDEGSNKLTSPDQLKQDIEQLVQGKHPVAGKIPELWDGETAGRIVKHLLGGNSVAVSR